MIDEPQFKSHSATKTAVIHLTIPAKDCIREFGPAVGELMSVLSAQNLSPAGAVFSHHLKHPGEIFDFEVGVPINGELSAAGRVKPGTLPEGIVATTIYHGPYEGLPEAWGAFTDWIKAQNVKEGSTLWESYAIGPAQSSDPSGWQTILNRPVFDK